MSITLSEATEMLCLRPHLRPATRRTYRYDLDHFADHVGKEMKVVDITHFDILRYSKTILPENPDNGIRSDATYNKHVTSLNTLFNFLVEIGEIDKSPTTVLKRRNVDEHVPEEKAMPTIKLTRLIDYTSETARGWKPREEALVRLLADTGIRISGIANLEEKHLDLNARLAVIYQKGKVRPHTVPFGIKCGQALSAWLLKRKATEGQFVFSRSGKRIHNENQSQFFRRLCMKAGIGSWGPHSLRHRYALEALKKGFDVATVARMLDDTVEVVLKHYVRHSEAHVEQAMRAMSTDYMIEEGWITEDQIVVEDA